MDTELEKFLDRIYEDGQKHDSGNHPHEEKMLNITPDTGKFLSILIRAVKAKKVLEIGTSNGYSTIWLADAVSKMDGSVTTIEVSPVKHAIAVQNFKESGLKDYINPILQDAVNFLSTCGNGSFDFLFLDAERPQYRLYLQSLDRVLKINGLLVVDNAISPKPYELAELIDFISRSGRYDSQVIEIGKGELLALKHA